MKTDCDYPYGWIKKTITSHQKHGETQSCSNEKLETQKKNTWLGLSGCEPWVALKTDALPTGPSRQSWINSLNPSSSSAFPTFISGVHHFGVRFLPMWPFFNPTIDEVTFCLRGWCMLGVFLLPEFTHLEHECQDLLSLCDGMLVCTD